MFEILKNPITGERLHPLTDFFLKKMFGELGCEESVLHLIQL
jgi:hypothetical protein